ncbi:MAG: amino acid permease-associated region [Bryobacterales bacterium]|nr:amino acid permease-associated region [Bryobacterales bacterium]
MQLRRELGTRDLTFFSIATIVGARWIASAAHAGSGSILLWVLAALFFLIPLALAVTALTIRQPEAGGMYLWAHADFGPAHGFLCFWVYWIGTAFWFPGAAMFYMSAAAWSLGPHFQHLAENRWYLVLASLAAIWVALGTNIIGVRFGKWTENVGAVASWLLGALLVIAAVLVWRQRGPATEFHLLPKLDWSTLSFWATIAYAMTGFEVAGMMGGEIRDPARDLPRAAWYSAAFSVIFYAGATAALLVILPAEQISDLNGLAQTGDTAGRILGAPWLAPLIAVMVLCSAIGQFGGMGSSAARMPFAAGVDGLLPAAFAKVHPRWATPWLSILTMGLVASVMLISIQLGDTVRAAYQTVVSLMVISGFLPFIYVFGSAWKAGKRISSLFGWAVTVLAILCSLVPSDDIHNVWLFELKLLAGTLAVIGSGYLVYRRTSARATNESVAVRS